MNVTWRPQRYRTIKLLRTVFKTVVSFCILLPRPHCIFALMVMHARKPQRISDGYFEKNQAHPYQKYNNKNDRRGNEYINVDGRYSQLVSPNGNVGHGGHGHASHSHHHYAHCDDRQYARGAWPVHKPCEKERDRDYKPSRDKYADSVNKRGKDSERERSNHERSEPEKKIRTSGVNSSVNKSNKYEKRSATTNVTVPPGSEWSEHISSSGKRYYYNAISEVSQWEKPREWDLRRTSSKESTTYPSRTNHEKRADSRTGKYSEKYPEKYPEKYSEKYPEKYPEKYTEKPNKRTNSQRYWNSNSGRDEDGHDRKRLKRSSVAHEECPLATDMEISPDRSPVSESSYRVPREITATGRSAPESSSKVPPVVVIDNSTHQGGSLLAAALPRIAATPVHNNGKTVSPVLEISPGASTPHRDAGPPTPTHSENMDPHAPPIHLENALPRRMESLGSYSSVVGNSSLQVPPILTPSLMNSVRTDLMGHVTNWPADILEKQANKYLDEAYHLGCLQCTRVSSELKCSRSLVRHTEIQATLQEQKIMYLRQQITRLEELRSQNTFMSDD